MRVIVWFFLVIEVLLLLSRVIWLAANKYPRLMTYKPWEDAFAVILHTGIVCWIVVVLFR